jgi:iron complex transport system permease protein
MNSAARARTTHALLAVGVALSLALALMFGSVSIPLGEIVSCFRNLIGGAAADDTTSRILLSTRLPRIVLGASVGMVLALAGLASQTLFRNPLASPSIMGVSSGAAFGAVLGILLAGSSKGFSFSLVPIFSLAGGAAVAVAVFWWGRRGRFFGQSVLLAGIAISALCSSLTTGALYVAGEKLQAIVFWLMGGLWQASWRDALIMLAVAAVGLAGLVLLAPSMNLALLGETHAHNLGLNLPRLQRLLLTLIALMVALAVSFTGTIGFIGLIVPHLIRLLLGSDLRRLVIPTAAGGAILLLSADLLARTLASPAEIPVGIFTASLGAAVFLWLLWGQTQRLPSV